MQGVFDFYVDLPARPKRPERLFFGLLPDPETARRVETLAERYNRTRRLAGKRVDRERLHVSLHHVGDFKRLETRYIHAARRAARAVSMPRFEMTFRRLASFEGAPSGDGRQRGRPLVLLAEGEALSALHKRLGSAMRESGLRAAEEFAPHMTLFYGAGAVPVEAIEPIRVAVGEFVLIHSERGLGRYNLIDRWPLGG